MSYIVIELQTTNGQTSNIVTTYSDLAHAESAYHSILASAALSEVEYHTALILNEQGMTIEQRCFEHE